MTEIVLLPSGSVVIPNAPGKERMERIFALRCMKAAHDKRTIAKLAAERVDL